MRPLTAMFIDPSAGLYDVSTCYIAANGDPFIVMDDCSALPGNNIEPNATVRAKEFELASKAGEELKQMQFPHNMQRVQQVLVSVIVVDISPKRA